MACARGGADRAAPVDGGAATTDAVTADVPTAAPLDAASAREAAWEVDPTAKPARASSVGHTSYVLKVTLDDGHVVAFKPRSRLALGDRRYKGEIAAYRLAVALDLPNVLPAVPRGFPAEPLRAVVEGFDAKARVDDDGRVRGAMMPWLKTYRVLPLETDAWRARWEPWVFDAGAAVPDAERARAAAIATMIAFDYLTANWDRYSGGNVAEDRATGTVLFVDNDGAFYDPPDAAALRKQLASVRRLARFSRRFVAALRALDRPRLAAAIGDETPGDPLLSDRVLRGVDDRRRAILAAVDTRIGDAGEGATLAFE